MQNSGEHTSTNKQDKDIGAKLLLKLKCACAMFLNTERVHMDPIPCKRKQFWIRSHVNPITKMDRIRKYPDSFGSDLYAIPCKRGLNLYQNQVKC